MDLLQYNLHTYNFTIAPMNNKKSIINTPRYYFLIILCCLLWGSAFAGAKIGFEYVPPIFLSGIRFTLAGLLLVPTLIIQNRGDFWSLFKHWKYMLLFGFIQTFMQYGIFFLGLNEVPGAVAAIIVGAGPIFVIIMAHLTMSDDKFTTRKILSSLLGFSGILFITLAKGGMDIESPNFVFGVSMLVISNLVGASTNILAVKKKSLGVSPIALTSFANFSGGLMLFCTSLFVEPVHEIVAPPLEFYFAVLWLAIIPAVGFSVWYYLLGLDGVKVSELNIWKFIIPIVGSVLSWMLIEGESPKWQEIVGIFIISTSILILQYTPKKRGV